MNLLLQNRERVTVQLRNRELHNLPIFQHEFVVYEENLYKTENYTTCLLYSAVSAQAYKLS